MPQLLLPSGRSQLPSGLQRAPVCCTCVQHRGEVDIDSMCKEVSGSIVATREARLPVHMCSALHYAPHPVLLRRAKLLHNFKCVDEAWFRTELQMLSLVTDHHAVFCTPTGLQLLHTSCAGCVPATKTPHCTDALLPAPSSGFRHSHQPVNPMGVQSLCRWVQVRRSRHPLAFHWRSGF